LLLLLLLIALNSLTLAFLKRDNKTANPDLAPLEKHAATPLKDLLAAQLPTLAAALINNIAVPTHTNVLALDAPEITARVLHVPPVDNAIAS